MADGISEAEEKLKGHIGFEKEKKTFLNHIQVICYVGAPGMGKTTFVQTLAGAMKRPCAVVSLSGFQESAEYSILGEEDKPIILLDELEKAEDPKIQKELLELFQKYKKGEKFTDKYFDQEIELEHITFFATEKKKILRAKANDIQEKHQELVIPDQIIEAILNHIREPEYLQNYRIIAKTPLEPDDNDYIKYDSIECYAGKKDQTGQILKQKDCPHCQPWKYNKDTPLPIKTCLVCEKDITKNQGITYSSRANNEKKKNYCSVECLRKGMAPKNEPQQNNPNKTPNHNQNRGMPTGLKNFF
ncbi:12381_t:CDS:2 [Entrophospora sp. SA101]|nr:12381_t:CDS:2 [Entrophospora sp. SA101]